MDKSKRKRRCTLRDDQTQLSENSELCSGSSIFFNKNISEPSLTNQNNQQIEIPVESTSQSVENASDEAERLLENTKERGFSTYFHKRSTAPTLVLCKHEDEHLPRKGLRTAKASSSAHSQPSPKSKKKSKTKKNISENSFDVGEAEETEWFRETKKQWYANASKSDSDLEESETSHKVRSTNAWIDSGNGNVSSRTRSCSRTPKKTTQKSISKTKDFSPSSEENTGWFEETKKKWYSLRKSSSDRGSFSETNARKASSVQSRSYTDKVSSTRQRSRCIQSPSTSSSRKCRSKDSPSPSTSTWKETRIAPNKGKAKRNLEPKSTLNSNKRQQSDYNKGTEPLFCNAKKRKRKQKIKIMKRENEHTLQKRSPGLASTSQGNESSTSSANERRPSILLISRIVEIVVKPSFN